MNALELVALLGLTVWSVYKQTRLAEVAGRGRFKMAIIYAAVGLAVGGFAMPHGIGAAALLLGGLALSAVVGWLRGRMTPMWMDADGRVWRKGNVKTVLMFLALVASKFVLGAVAYLAHINDGAGFGEVLFMIAIMIAVQAEIIFQRGQALTRSAQQVMIPA